MNDVIRFISKFLSKSSNVNEIEIESDTKIVDSSVFSSLTMMELVMAIENCYGIEVSAEDLTEENFATVGSLASYISRITAEQQSSSAA